MTKLRTTKAVKAIDYDRNLIEAWVAASRFKMGRHYYWNDCDAIVEPELTEAGRLSNINNSVPVWTANVTIMRDRLKLMQEVAHKFFSCSANRFGYDEQAIADIKRFGRAIPTTTLKLLKTLTSAMPYLEVVPIYLDRSELKHDHAEAFIDPYHPPFDLDEDDSKIIPTGQFRLRHHERLAFAFIHKGCDMPSGTLYASKDHHFEIASPLLNQRERSSSAVTTNPQRALALCRKHFKYEPPKNLRQHHLFRRVLGDTQTLHQTLKQDATKTFSKVRNAVADLLGDLNNSAPETQQAVNFLLNSDIPKVREAKKVMFDKCGAYLDSLETTRQLCWLKMLPDQQVSYILLDSDQFEVDHRLSDISKVISTIASDPDETANELLSRIQKLLADLERECKPNNPFREVLTSYMSPMFTEPAEQLPPEVMAKVAVLSMDDTDKDFIEGVGMALSRTEFVVYVSDIFNILNEGEADA